MDLDIRQKKVVESEDTHILCLASAGSGKALPNSVKIPALDGWKTVGEVKPGDYLFDRQGNPTKVLEIFPQGKKEVYELTFGDGRKAKCSKEHIWYVKHKDSRCKYRELTVEQLLKKRLIGSSRGANYYIPCAEAVKFSKKEYRIPPYVMGAFLGDGCCLGKSRLVLSSKDSVIPNICASFLGKNVTTELWYNNKYQYQFYDKDTNKYFFTKEYFSGYEESVLQYSYNKFIPEEYKCGSIEQRLELIQGLLDTDGSIQKDGGSVRYTSTSLKLIKDVQDVLNSLGYVSRLFEEKRKELYTNTCYYILINIENSEKHKLFRVPRKKEIALSYKNTKQKRHYECTSIRAIENLGYEEEMTCFLVDNEEHLFLTNDCIVTHNTRVLTERIRYLAEIKKVDHSKIVAISFTNLAAEEMRKRLANVADGIWIGTIHSYANYLCLKNGLDTQKYIENYEFDKILEKALTLRRRTSFDEIDHLLVDECQDLSDLEVKFLSRLPSKNTFYVGDERQAIYGFKGCSDKYLHLMATNPQVKVYFLNRNYRNAPNIISAANDYLRTFNAVSPAPIAVKDEDGIVEYCSFNEAYEELKDSGNWGIWFILARTNADVDAIMTTLEKDEVPCVTFKKGDLNEMELEELLAENRVKVLTIHACMTGDTLVHTSEGIIPIAEIVRRKDKNLKVYNGAFYDEIQEFIDNGIDTPFKITTKFGNNIKLTSEHDCMTLGEKGLDKIKTKNLKIGDELLIRKNIYNYEYRDNIPLKQITKEELYHNTTYYTTPNFLNEDLAELIGMITADGTSNDKSIHYVKRYKKCAERFANLIHKLFNKTIEVKKASYEDAYLAECNSVHILNFLLKNFNGITSHNKFISSIILQASPEIQCAFLRGLFEDGTVSLKGEKVDNVTLTFKNDFMQNQLQTLLFTLGIDASFKTRVYNEKKLNYCEIYSTGLTLFKEKVNFISDFKKQRLEGFEQKYQRKNKSTVLKQIMLNSKDKLWIIGQSKFWVNLEKNQSLTDGAFYKYYSLMSKEQKKLPEVKYIKQIFDFFQIEPVESIEELPEERTYCLTMKTIPQFTQNGFLMGNSKGLECKRAILCGARTYNEEERKIAYVGATRPENALYICPAVAHRKRKDNRLTDRTAAGDIFGKTAKKMITF